MTAKRSKEPEYGVEVNLKQGFNPSAKSSKLRLKNITANVSTTKRELLNTCVNTLEENKKLWFEVPQPASSEKIIYPVLNLAIHQTQSPLKDPKSDLLSREEIFKQRNSKLLMLSGLGRSQEWNLIYDQMELLHEALQLMMHLIYSVQKANMDPFQNFMKVLDILITWASNNHS